MIDVELRAPLRMASVRARWYWTVRALTGWLAVGAAEAVLLAVSDPSPAVGILLPALTGLPAVVHLLVMPQWRYRVHRWEVTETAAYTQAGWLRQERRIAPLVRIQTVDTERGPFEALFGLANLTATTASAKGPIKIHALDRAVADETAAWLTARARTVGGDAT